MPRKIARQPVTPQEPQPFAEKKWAEPYRPVVTHAEAGFELGENKHSGKMVFTFMGDPGETAKQKLKHYGYFYNGQQKTWTVNATPLTREIAKKLAAEFAGEVGFDQQPDLPNR